MYKLTIDRMPLLSYKKKKQTLHFLKVEEQVLLLQRTCLFLTGSVVQPQTASDVMKSDQSAEAPEMCC